jgi:cytochrome oxidase Cu insertion factor (SCO1/SenC/PrrC family)
MYNKLKDNKNFEFISFTFETEEKIKELKSKYKIDYQAVSIKSEECYRLNNNNGFPTNIIGGPDGLIKYRIEGGKIEKDKAEEFIMTGIYHQIVKLL